MLAALVATALLSMAQGASAGSLAEQITAASQKNFGEYFELLSIAGGGCD